MSAITVPARSSSFIHAIDIVADDNVARVLYKNETYGYFEVSDQAIEDLLNPLTSFGLWFNKYCR